MFLVWGAVVLLPSSAQKTVHHETLILGQKLCWLLPSVCVSCAPWRVIQKCCAL